TDSPGRQYTPAPGADWPESDLVVGSAGRAPAGDSGRTLAVEPAEAEVLDVDVVVEAVLRALAPVTGFLDAAERRHRVRDDALVDADDAVLQPLRDAPDAADVARVEIAREAERRVVGEADRLLLGFEPEQRRHRPEDLLVEHAHV